MRILSIDEIPMNWRDVITEHWIARYRVFADDIQTCTEIGGYSVQNVANILSWKTDSKFPYFELKVTKPSEINLRLLNKRNHMWVLVQDETDGSTQFIHGRLQPIGEIDYSNIGTEITL